MNDAASIDVLGIGFLAVDDVIYVDSYPPPDVKVDIKRTVRKGGGNCAAALAAVAALGGRAALACRLGEDDCGRFAISRLAEVGVDTSRIQVRPEYETLHATIVVAADTGSRTIMAGIPDSAAMRPDQLRAEWFDGPGVLLVDFMHMPTSLRAAQLAHENGMEVVFDIERESPMLEEVMAQVDHIICSLEFALAHTGTVRPAAAVRRLAEEFNRTVTVTAGAEGCWWRGRDEDRVHHQPAFPIEVRDTTGCGDMFHGGFAFARARGWPVPEAIVLASAVGALKATRIEGWSAAPRPEALLDLLSRHTDQPAVPSVIDRLSAG